jgi:hypothetical protein
VGLFEEEMADMVAVIVSVQDLEASVCWWQAVMRPMKEMGAERLSCNHTVAT